MVSLSLMQDEQLAEEVRLYPSLYDKSDEGYKERKCNILSTKSIEKAPQGVRVPMFSRKISKISFANKNCLNAIPNIS